MSDPQTPSDAGRTRRRIPFVARIVVAMLVGVLLGLWLGKSAEPFGEIGAVVINLIKALAAPLLFFAIVDAFLRAEVKARAGLWMVAISLTNATFAIVIGLALSNILRPGDLLRAPSSNTASGTAARRQTVAPRPEGQPAREPASAQAAGAMPKRIDFLKSITGLLPTSVGQPFVENAVPALVLLAVLGGVALRKVRADQQARGETAYRAVEDAVETLLQTLETMLGWIIALVPPAVMGVVARTIGRDGFKPMVGLGAYLGVALLGLALQVGVVYQTWVVLVARRSLRWFWSGAREAVVYAAGASSSLATLPVTLRSLDRMGISTRSARLAACVGTNLNNDGILLYEAMAALFVAQVYGIHLSLGAQALTAASCAIAGIGIAGVPEAGLISLALVLATVGLPTEILPLLLPVDWLLSRARAVTNVTSDLLVAILLDKVDPPRPGASSEDGKVTPTGFEPVLRA